MLSRRLFLIAGRRAVSRDRGPEAENGASDREPRETKKQTQETKKTGTGRIKRLRKGETMDQGTFTYEAAGQALIIHLPREVDHHNCLTLKYETDLLLAENYIRRMVFDFSGTEFMDSSGIGILLNRYKQMAGSGGSVSIYGAGTRIRRILQIGGVYRLVRQCETREEAVYGKQGR